MAKFYTTTAIDYVNGAPHIGHAYEKILTEMPFYDYVCNCACSAGICRRARGNRTAWLLRIHESGTGSWRSDSA